MGGLTTQPASIVKSSNNKSTSRTSTPPPAWQVNMSTKWAEHECDEHLVDDS